MADWSAIPPRTFDLVTGFFPEARPKHNWKDNPRPMLVSGVYRGKATREIWVRIAYGTSQMNKVRGQCLQIGNLSDLDSLNLARPTAFVLSPGAQHAILPWSAEHFAPWRGFGTPVISRLPRDMQDYVAGILKGLTDLPFPPVRKDGRLA